MLDSLEIAQRSELIKDGGPFYNEFIADQCIKEPWNAYSSLLFFIPIIFWLIKLKGAYRQHLIIVALLPFLFLNGLGSTLYHAFRSNELFFYLDVIPAALMSFILACYFWTNLLKNWLKAMLLVIVFYVVGWSLRYLLVQTNGLEDFGPNVSYFFVGAAFLVPLFFQLYQSNYFKWKLVVMSLVFLVGALLFRSLDYPSQNYFAAILPQGTHFLWHIFTVLAVFSLGFYIFHFKNREISNAKLNV